MTNETRNEEPSADAQGKSGRSDLSGLIDAFANGVRAAAGAARKHATQEADRLKQESREHPLETVTGAFGLGYLIGKAVFKRRRE